MNLKLPSASVNPENHCKKTASVETCGSLVIPCDGLSLLTGTQLSIMTNPVESIILFINYSIVFQKWMDYIIAA